MTVSGELAHYLCNDCGRDLPGTNLSTICLCGSSSWRRVEVEGAAYRRPLTADAPPWDPLKDWTVKYLQLAWNVGQLRLMYRDTPEIDPPAMDAAQARRVVDSTFASCVGLGEWLTFGAEPVAVTPGDIGRLMSAEPLSVCVVLCAADADGDDAATARIVPIAFASGHQYWVEYQRPDARTIRYDALALAEECLLTWQSFLTARGVELPNWYA